MDRYNHFNAWLKKEYYSVLNPENKIYCVENLDFDKQQAYLAECGWFDFEDIELMQYTGLKDKNGVKIFEGDIVKCKVYAIDNETFEIDDIGEVVYDDDCCAYFIQFNEGYIHLTSAWNLEVIGNIYENPELSTL